MARYIKDCDCAKVISEKFNIPLGDVIDVVYDIPTADVVEVVRCKDCKYWCKLNMSGWCENEGKSVERNDFCSYGERRTDNDTL